jgi:MFS family permease
VWILFLAPAGLSCVPLTFAGLWGVPFLVSLHEFSPRSAALVCSAMLLAWSMASMVFGPMSQAIGRRKPVYFAGLVGTLLLWTIVVFVPLPTPMLVAVLLLVSAAAGTFILTFAFARESVPAHLGGTAAGIANMGVMLGGMVMQPLVGLVLDWRWEGVVENGARVYGADAFRWGLSLMLAWSAASIALVALSRESYCRPAEATASGIPASTPAR